MNTRPSSESGATPYPHRLTLSRGALVALSAVALALLMVGLVLAANNPASFPPAAEQIGPGESYSGTYTDTHTADGVYRVLQETYVTGTARTLADNPNELTYSGTYTNVIAFVPYTMPPEGGFIYRIAPYIFQTGTTQLRVALYADTEGLPRLLLAQSEVLTVSDVLTEPGWLWFDIEPQRIPGNTRYWLAYQADNDQAQLGWKLTSAAEEYRQRPWNWGPFPPLAGTTWGSGTGRRSFFQIAYTATQYALDAAYTVPVTPSLDAYTLTVRGATSGEPFSVTADGQAVGLIPYTPTAHTAFSDDMESGLGGWTADGFTLVVTDSEHTRSPTHAWWADDVPYSRTATLTSMPITIPFSARDVELQFWMRMVSEFEWDGGWLEYRIGDENGNWSPWSEIAPTDILKGHYNCLLGALAGCQGLVHLVSGPHNGWSGEGEPVSGTIRVQVPISATGRLIQWRWVFECDPVGGEPTTQPNGWWIDDVRVVGTTSEDTLLVWPLPVSAADDGQVIVRFQDTLTNSYPDFLGIDWIELTGILYNRAPVVTVTFPNGGEYLSGTQTVSWEGLDVNGDVVTYNVYLSLDNGATWSESLYQVSYRETEEPATHSWSEFDTTIFSDSQACLIRIQASDGDANAFDQSDAVFAIDNTPRFLSISDTSVTEGDSGTTTAVFTVTLSAASGRVITVTYATADGTATAGTDYVAASGTLTFAPGETTRTLTVTVNGDTLDEPDETFTVNLSNAVNATIADGQGVGTILDDDPEPTLSISDTSVTEGDGGTTTAVFTVTLSAASGRVVSVTYATADGTATAGADYVAASGTLTFAPGETTRTLTVTVIGDTLDEPDETFTVNLSNAVNATIARGQGVGMILDDDFRIYLPLVVRTTSGPNAARTSPTVVTLDGTDRKMPPFGMKR